MKGHRMLGIGLVLGFWLASEHVAHCQQKNADEKKQDLAKEVAAAREKGLDCTHASGAEQVRTIETT
jgi:hypothetical protein